MTTSLVALHAETGARLTIGDTPLDTLRALSDARLLRCEVCGGQLTLKAGDVRIHHFAHVSLIDCTSIDHEPETDTHRQGKLMLYHRFRVEALDAAVERHLPTTDQRADVFIETPDHSRYALEFQQANNSAERWTQRHALYREMGVHDIWFLGQIRYQESRSEPLRPISPYDPGRVPRHEFEAAAGAFRIRDMERAMLTLTTDAEGTDLAPSENGSPNPRRLYYLDPENGMLTVLLMRDLHYQTLRAYRYRVPLDACSLRAGSLWTPLDTLIATITSSGERNGGH